MPSSKLAPKSTDQEDRNDPVHVYSSIQAYLLERLTELVERRKDLEGQPASEDGHYLSLTQKAIFAAYVDCLEEGVGGEALDILRGESLAAAA